MVRFFGAIPRRWAAGHFPLGMAGIILGGSYGTLFTYSLESLPRIFSALHRQSLRLEVDHHSIAGIKDETAARFLELVGEGFNLRVLRDGHAGMNEEYRHFQTEQGSIAQE
jgi:hypothetical protein